MSGIRIPTVLYNIQIPLLYVLFKFRYYWYVQICFHMKPIQTYLIGAFINDIAQVGDVSNIVIMCIRILQE